MFRTRNRKSRVVGQRRSDPLLQQVRKLLTDNDQKLILMVKN